MPDYTALLNRFFKADSLKVSGPVTLTIDRVDSEELENDGKKAHKPIVYFKEDPRGVVLNGTRYDACSEIFGGPNTDKWVGGRIELFFDSSVRNPNGGKGGVGIRPPRV